VRDVFSCHEQAGSRVGCRASAGAAFASLQAELQHKDTNDALSAQRTGIAFQFLRSNSRRCARECQRLELKTLRAAGGLHISAAFSVFGWMHRNI